jgi:DNA helicase HerA-like ATPase/CRISPR/Cas system-associated exonuclease Cas4 (RecB family)
VPFLAPVHFTASQVRVAASCPRILYFDALANRRRNGLTPRITRIWEKGESETTAGGSLFHATVEKFNRLAARGDAVRQMVRRATSRDELLQSAMAFLQKDCLNRGQLLRKPANVIANFSDCIETYIGELADIIHYAKSIRKDPDEIVDQLFADMPRRVDVTFHVGPQSQPVHVTGRLDYVFFDWRDDHLRIVDYKLTPARNPNKDQAQVAIYALMYQLQHRYQCNAAVFYLHPGRHVVEMSWEQVEKERAKIYNLLASMVEWSRYSADEGLGQLPPGETSYCGSCPWRPRCEPELGPKALGSVIGWRPEPAEPVEVVVVDPPAITPEAVADEEQALAEEREIDLQDDVAANPPVDLPRMAKLASVEKQPGPGPGVTAARNQELLSLGQFAHTQRPVAIRSTHLCTHTAVVGAAGSGKTWLAKVLAEEAILNGVPVLAIDPQGDLVQFLKQRPEAEIAAQAPELLGRYREFAQRVEPRIFTPGTSHAIKLRLNPIRLPRRDDVREASAERREEEYSGLIDAVALNLVGLVSAGKKSLGTQQAFVGRVLRSLVETSRRESLELSEIASAIIQPESAGILDSDHLIKKSERETLGRQINALAHGPLKKLFTGGVALDIDRMRTPVTPGKVPLNIIYLNALTEVEKHAFLAALATEVYRWMCCAGGDTSQPQLLFYLDEARDFLPAGASKPVAKEPVSRLFAQARKFGVGCLVCTQSPRSVDYNVFGNCSTKLIGKLETPQDSDTIGKWFESEGPKPDWIRQRAGAESGTFVGRWPGQDAAEAGQMFQSRLLFSAHGGAWTAGQIEAELQHDPTHLELRRQWSDGP